MNTTIQQLFSQSQVSRLANLTPPRIIQLVKAGKVVPDFQCGKTLLFKPENAQKIKGEFGQ